MNFPLPTAAARWAQRPPTIPRRTRRHTHEFDDKRVSDLEWVWVGDQRMFVVGHTCGGAPFGCYPDELKDSPLATT
jgi:hypothetical protein